MKEEKEEYVGGWLGDKPMGWGLLTYKNDDFYLGKYILSLFHKGIFSSFIVFLLHVVGCYALVNLHFARIT